MTQPRRRRRKMLQEAVAYIEEEARKGALNATEIWEAVEVRWGEGTGSLRTVQAIVAVNRPKDDTLPWSLADSSPAEAALVMPVLTALIKQSGGKKKELTHLEAEWVARVRSVASWLEPWEAYQFAREYIVRLSRPGQGTGDLDRALAITDPKQPEILAANKGTLITESGSTMVHDFLEIRAAAINSVGILPVDINKKEDHDGEA